ncbi:hypothetical protein ACWDRR_43345 [Kitasatospora sp. NPDC003701]
MSQPTRTPRPPIPAERLDAFRSLDVVALLPEVASWHERSRQRAALTVRRLGPVITELLDEIDALDEALDESETELEQLLASTPEPTSTHHALYARGFALVPKLTAGLDPAPYRVTVEAPDWTNSVRIEAYAHSAPDAVRSWAETLGADVRERTYDTGSVETSAAATIDGIQIRLYTLVAAPETGTRPAAGETR